MRILRSGQNTEIGSGRIRFVTDRSSTAAVLLVDERGQALRADGWLTNGRSGPGVDVGGSSANIDTGELSPGVSRVLCVALDPTPEVALACRIEPANTIEATGVLIGPQEIFPAVICFEIYRRASRWKLRAVGQGYRGGAVELLAAHGLDDHNVTTPNIAGAHALAPDSDDDSAGFPPLGASNPIERLSMIFEDATRITAALLSARNYADSRLDADLSAAVADPRTRNTPAAIQSADAAHQRHGELVARATTDYRRDAAYLSAEIDALDPQLPTSMASWESPSWGRPVAPGPGIRLGTVSRPDVGGLTVPLCAAAPLRQPVWIGTAQASAGAPLAAALILRLLVSSPQPATLDLIDVEGTLRQLCRPLHRWMSRPAASVVDDAVTRLQELAYAADLATMGGCADPNATSRVVVVTEFPFGLSPASLGNVAVLISKAIAAGLSIIIVGDPNLGATEVSQLLRDIADRCLHLRVESGAALIDPWTRTPWQFTPSVLEAEGRLADLVESVTATPR